MSRRSRHARLRTSSGWTISISAARSAYLFDHSSFYREKLAHAGFLTAEAIGGLDRIAALPFTEKQEIRASCTAENPIGAHLAVSREKLVRIYSTSGTTGTPSYIPLTTQDLDNWVTTSARSYSASGIAAGETIVSTYNAGPFVAGAALAAFDRLGMCHVPVGTGNTERLMAAIRLLKPTAAVMTPSYASHLIEWAAERGIRSAKFQRQAGSGGGRAGRRRASDAASGWNRAGVPKSPRHGHRRHRRLAVGRMRGADRHASSAGVASSMPN